MAVIIPSGWRELQITGGAAREIETLAILEEVLPDAYTVYHGVHWTRVDRGFSAFGEIDFAIVAPSGRVLIIEQKSGYLEETPEGLSKAYAGKTKSVPAQLSRSVDALRTRYAKGRGNPTLWLDYLLYCPDYTVKQLEVAGIDPARIVDAKRRDHLAATIQSILPSSDAVSEDAERVHAFLLNVLDLVPEIGTVTGEAGKLYTRISGGLSTWARRIEVDPFRLRVVGTAGSGKTQLALSVLRDAAAAGRRALYLCFNRPLADHMAQVAPREATVATYHQFCESVLRTRGVSFDFAKPGAFEAMESGFAAAELDATWQFDELIVDEGQDFSEAWVAPLLRVLRPSARAWWLEDPMQNLYGRPPVPLPGWTTLHSDTNYRSPRDILEDLNRLVQLDRPIEAGSPLSGSGVVILTYASTQELIEQTKHAVAKCTALGFKRSMVALVTFRGRESSALTPYTELGPYRLRTFTGSYDLLGSPVYSNGDVTIETVFRFKGQSAPAVVFTEVDFEVLDEITMRRLFVGATRATMKLVLVMSERAARILAEHMT